MSSQMIQSLRRLSNRSDETAEQMADFARRQTGGEQPDPAEFGALLRQRSVTHDVMSAQLKLLEKPLRTVLQETK
jgi:hypothetical protein